MSSCRFLVVVVVMLCGGMVVECSNVLVFSPYPAVSHHRVFWPVIRELLNRGHNVTMFSPLIMPQSQSQSDPDNSNYTHLPIQDYTQQLKSLEDTGFMMSSNFLIRFFQNSMFFMDMGRYLTERVLASEIFQWLIKSDSQFDVIIGEWTFSNEVFSVLHHRFSAINVDLSSFGNFHWAYYLYGQPFDPSYIADSDSSFSDHMTFFERLQNTVQSLSIRLMWSLYYMPIYQRLMDQYVRYPGWERRADIMSLMRNTSLVLLNTHYSLNYPYPNAPHVKEIGGINILQPQPLPPDIKELMDGAKHGVIYFSLGSFLEGSSVLQKEVEDNLVKVFGRLKQRVIWKWETGIEPLPANIMIKPWLPQQGILAHKNCRLFISHAGFLSLAEAVNEGVPVVAVPIWADQLRNSKQMVSRGLAVELHFSNLTQQSLTWAIDEVLDNPKYKMNAVRQSEIFRDKPETALETAVYWIEYVIRHKGAPHLRPAIADMPWYQQAMLDVYLAIALLISLPLYIVYAVCICLVAKCRGNRKEKKRKIQ